MVSVARCFLLLVLFPTLAVGQAYRFTPPELLPSNINSDADEVMPLLSFKGRSLYFSRAMWPYNVGGRYAGHDIWVSDRTSSGWTRANNHDIGFNTKGNDAVIGVGKVGDEIYLMRAYPKKRVKGIYVSRKNNQVWTEPALVPIAGLESLGSIGFYMHPDGTVLLISMHASDSKGEEDLYVCRKLEDGTWTAPRNLGTTINTSGYEISPFLSDDKRRLYFASTGHKGMGQADMFVSQRLHDSWETWTVPVNLGDKINSKGDDAYFSIYGDTLAYYASNKSGQMEIYTTRVEILEGNMLNDPKPLRRDEVASLIGEKVRRELIFEPSQETLDAVQRELLWFIAHRLISQKDVRIILVPSEKDQEEVTSKRINAVIAQLVSGGIEGSRINRKAHNVMNIMPEKGEVILVLAR